METIGQRFKRIRTEKGLSQSDFGTELGMLKSGISAVENDKVFVSVDVLRSLFLNFNINLNWLICGQQNMHNKIPITYEQVKDDFEAKVEEVLKKKGLIL